MNEPTIVWQSGDSLGAVRMVANPLSQNDKPQSSSFVFEKRIPNDAMGNECWQMLFEPAWQDAPGKLHEFFKHFATSMMEKGSEQ